MTNDPSSGQSGGPPPEERPEDTGPPPSSMGETGGMGGGSMPESSGEPTRDFSAGAPPPSGEYSPPPAGGYTPPPASGGYTPPAESGGYAPPPSGGGYAPPPPGSGYTPPPSGGGYAPPPPPPGGGYGPPPASAGGGELNFQALIQSYINAVTKPNAGTYEAEIPNASWVKTLIGVGAVALISAIFSLFALGATDAALDQMESQMAGQVDVDAIRAVVASTANPVAAFIGPFISFFLGALMLYILARLYGGQGNDFMVHSYLLSLSYTPTRIASSVLGIIPCLNLITGIVLPLYQLYLAGLSMQASQRLAPGRAQMAAWTGLIIFILVFCLGFFLCVGTLAAMIGGAATVNP